MNTPRIIGLAFAYVGGTFIAYQLAKPSVSPPSDEERRTKWSSFSHDYDDATDRDERSNGIDRWRKSLVGGVCGDVLEVGMGTG